MPATLLAMQADSRDRQSDTRIPPVRYMERTRRWYQALGYERSYTWARYDDVPFSKFGGVLADATVAVVTTATPIGPDSGPVLPKRVYSIAAAQAPAALYTQDLSWDKQATHTDDLESFLPLEALTALAAQGRIGALAARFHGVPTEYSQRRTNSVDAPEILARCREDNADAVLLVPL